MQLNEQHFIMYECVNAIGTSLELNPMLDHFLKVFSHKTGALASVYWKYMPAEMHYEQLCIYGKKSFEKFFISPTDILQDFTVIHIPKNEKILLHIKVHDDWIVFLFHDKDTDIEIIKVIIHSFKLKLENAIFACKNFLELKTINETLALRIEEEVSKNRKKDKQIMQQSRLAQMGEMISMIAHQWRQPLGSISTVSASLKLKMTLNRFNLDEQQGRDEQKKFIEDATNKIEGYVKFLTHTIDDFRNFFKPDKQKESITALKLVQRTLEIIGKALEINGITITVENHATKTFLTYTNEVTQVILNILKNAEDVIKERCVKNGCITILITELNHTQYISISDNAGGIPQEILPYIFEPYYSTKNEKNGTGLGLYMSKTIIEEHCGGKITAQNDALGATFIIELKEEK